MSKETWLTVKALCDKYGYSTSAYDKRFPELCNRGC